MIEREKGVKSKKGGKVGQNDEGFTWKGSKGYKRNGSLLEHHNFISKILGTE